MKLHAIHSKKTLIENALTEATVVIHHGCIREVIKGPLQEVDFPVENVGNNILMPGIIDPHVHINEPGTDWEGFDTATKAAAAGGVTSIVDMPLNSLPVTTNQEALEAKITASKGKRHVNCGFYGGIVPGNVENLLPMIEAGALGIKAFLIHSGIDPFPNVSLKELEVGMENVAKTGVPLLVHCEIDSLRKWDLPPINDPTSYVEYLQSRPKGWENDAVFAVMGLAEKTRCKTHIVHLSASDQLTQFSKIVGSSNGKITIETCPHYLFFQAENIPNGNPLYKCAPPIREKSNNDVLWNALVKGTISFIGSDHSPAPPAMKGLADGNLFKAWGGIASLQLNLPVMWTLARANQQTVGNLSKWMSHNPAAFLGIAQKKGQIKVGYDADLVVWDPNEKFTVKANHLHFRHKYSPYIGHELYGKVNRTYVNGKKVYDNGQFTLLNQGELILRS